MNLYITAIFLLTLETLLRVRYSSSVYSTSMFMFFSQVGMATNIPPHNLGELVDALSVLIHNPEATVLF